jgi:hypothetical protein
LTSVLHSSGRSSYNPVTMHRKPSRTRALRIPTIRNRKKGYFLEDQNSRVSWLLHSTEMGHHGAYTLLALFWFQNTAKQEVSEERDSEVETRYLCFPES